MDALAALAIADAQLATGNQYAAELANRVIIGDCVGVVEAGCAVCVIVAVHAFRDHREAERTEGAVVQTVAVAHASRADTLVEAAQTGQGHVLAGIAVGTSVGGQVVWAAGLADVGRGAGLAVCHLADDRA